MNPKIVSVASNEPVKEAISKMKKFQISQVPVIDVL